VKRIRIARLALFLGAAFAACVWAPARVAADSASGGIIEGRLKGPLSDARTITLERLPDSTTYTLNVADAEVPRLKDLAPDTVVRVDVDDRLNPARITRLDEIGVTVGAYQRIIAIGGSFLTLLLLATFATRGNPLRFLLGLDNRYSNSQCQIVLWFGLLAVIYVSAVALRIVYLGSDFIGGVGVTANVVALTGLSALSFGGAKIITAQKTSPGSRVSVTAAIAGKLARPHKSPAASPNLLTDLFQNDHGDADFGDFQMILVTLAAVAIYFSSAFVFLGCLWPDKAVTLPDIDSTLLSAFGLGQGAYLVKKAAMKPGEG
jgi:hypothetical protein